MGELLATFKARPANTLEPFKDLLLNLQQVESIFQLDAQPYPSQDWKVMLRTDEPCVEVTTKTGRTWVLLCTYVRFIEIIRGTVGHSYEKPAASSN